MKEIKVNWKVMLGMMILTIGSSFLVGYKIGLAFAMLCCCSILYYINKYIEAKEEHEKIDKQNN